jgi:hypothetical protein
MATQGGLGTTLTYNSQSITKIMEVDWPEIEKVLAEVTAHDSTGGWEEFIATGKFTASDFTITVLWDKALAGHGALLTASGSAFVSSIAEESDMEDGHKATITISPTGNVTIT